VDAAFRVLLTPALIEGIVGLVPDEWLVGGPWTESPDRVRGVYTEFLIKRMQQSAVFLENAMHARKTIV
jgi:hypothetical protein